MIKLAVGAYNIFYIILYIVHWRLICQLHAHYINDILLMIF